MITITKIDHCCLVVAIDGVTILTDPGMYSWQEQSVMTGIDAVLITHEHGDHYHGDSVKAIVKNNPKVRIITNSGVGRQLAAIGVAYEKVEGRDKTAVGGVSVESFDCRHEEIYEDWGQVQNTAYFIGQKLFFPGDAYCVPGVPVEVLALPVAGPWCRIGDAIRYGLKIMPLKAFPVHDGMFGRGNPSSNILEQIVGQIYKEKGVRFVGMRAGDKKEF